MCSTDGLEGRNGEHNGMVVLWLQIVVVVRTMAIKDSGGIVDGG